MHLCILWVFTRNIILYRELLFHWNYSSSEPWLAGLLGTVRSSTLTAPLSWSWLKAGHCLSLVHTEVILLLLFFSVYSTVYRILPLFRGTSAQL